MNKVQNNEKQQVIIQTSSWIKTFFLCYFLGILGAHRFYVGKNISGTIYLFTYGLFGIGVFIDFIMLILGKFTDKSGSCIKYRYPKSNNKPIILGNIEIFTNRGKKRFEMEINSAKFLISNLVNIQEKILMSISKVDLIPCDKFLELDNFKNRIIAIRTTIENISSFNLDTENANNIIEQIRMNLYNAINVQRALNTSLQNMDIATAQKEYQRLNQIISNTERYIRNNITKQEIFDNLGKETKSNENKQIILPKDATQTNNNNLIYNDINEIEKSNIEEQNKQEVKEIEIHKDIKKSNIKFDDIEILDNIEIFTNRDNRLFEIEIKSAKIAISILTNTQEDILNNLFKIYLMHGKEIIKFIYLDYRITAIRTTIENISSFNLDTEKANNIIEQIRINLYNAINIQRALNTSLQNMDITTVQNKYQKFNQIISNIERYIRNNITKQESFDNNICKESNLNANKQIILLKDEKETNLDYSYSINNVISIFRAINEKEKLNIEEQNKQEVKETEIHEDIKENDVEFIDIEILGDDENKQIIPQKDEYDDFDFYEPPFYNDFKKDMLKYKNLEGKETPYVPFITRYPTYIAMNSQQKKWYFYWRAQARKSNYLKTDLSYIFINIYELLSGYGWNNAQDGYKQLMSLWLNYRTEYPELDSYLLKWTFDFTQINNLDYHMPDLANISLPKQSIINDIMIDKHFKEKPLKLPFILIDALCDYSLVGSKFYREGHQALLNEVIPKVVTVADSIFLKKKGKGILKSYGPSKQKKQKHYIFQGANCVNAHDKIEIYVKAYTSSKKLREFINWLVKYSENVLRELHGYRGRLRNIIIDDEISDTVKRMVKHFLKKEYAPNKKESTEKGKIQLDFKNIDLLRSESNIVREVLEVIDEEQDTREVLADLDTIKEIFAALPQYTRTIFDEIQKNSWEITYDLSLQASIDKINQISNQYLACDILVVELNFLMLEKEYRAEFEYIYNHMDELFIAKNDTNDENNSIFELDKISEDLKPLVTCLSVVQQNVLRIVLLQDNVKVQLEEISNTQMTMPEILLDEINDIATQYIGDILIDTYGEIQILEQYEKELKSAIK